VASARSPAPWDPPGAASTAEAWVSIASPGAVAVVYGSIVYHVSLTYPGRRAVGAFVAPRDLERIRALRARGRPGAVPVLDSRARQIVVHVERLAADPEVLGYGADPLGRARAAGDRVASA